jgi:DNA (cytosine-5)-methyltransferase 1
VGADVTAYYNEIEPYAAQWLRSLIAAGHIAPGDVDERSITEVQADDLRPYTQAHFFAGIGGWSYALRLAGWPDDRPVWTGSCPCQPFSVAGQRQGHADERHLWPAFFNLIAQRAPSMVFGEQVASADGREWFAAVRTDLEAVGYACGAADLCAASIGAPHIRQRLWWVGMADAGRERCDGESIRLRARGSRQEGPEASGGGGDVGMADANGARLQGGREQALFAEGRRDEGHALERRGSPLDGVGRPSPPDSVWSSPDWLWCRDGKWRPVEPSTFPLAHGVSNRLGRLRAFGNAIVPQVAAVFVRAVMECAP